MQQMDTSPLSGSVDEEVFRRVWDRVMEGGGSSPIEVKPAKKEEQPQAAALPSSKEKPAEKEKIDGDGALLERGLEEIGAGLSLARSLARRGGRHGTALSALVSDHRRAARRLSAAYFLLRGDSRLPKVTAPAERGFALGLRELFWWERQWSQSCLEAAGQAEDSFLKELFQQLAQTAQIHLEMIRGILEQIQGAALDGGSGRGVH